MLIARILSPVHSLGPGDRVCLWTQGCKKRCKGCISPELQPYSGNEIDENVLAKILRQHRTIAPSSLSRLFAPLLQFQKWEIHTVFLHFRNFELEQKFWLRLLAELCGDALIQVARKNNCTGITISGGDPLEQSQALLKLLTLLRNEFDDILVYTGFELQDIQDGLVDIEAKKCLEYLDVLIDGKYIDELNYKDCVLRGSSNQRIHFINKGLAPIYAEYMKRGRILESFVHNENTIVTGIFNKEEPK